MVGNFVEQERSAQQSLSVDLAFFSLFFCATVLITSRATEREAQNRLESFFPLFFSVNVEDTSDLTSSDALTIAQTMIF